MKNQKVEIAKQLSVNGWRKCTLGPSWPEFKKPGHWRIEGDILTIRWSYEYDKSSKYLFTELTAKYNWIHNKWVKFEEKVSSAEIEEKDR